MTRNDRRAGRVKAGLCRDCGINSHKINSPVCEACFIKRQDRQERRKQRLVIKNECLQCKNLTKNKRILCDDCNSIQVKNSRLLRKRNKEFIVNHFGGRCVECGENDIVCLTLDHIDNDGHLEERKSNGKRINSVDWYRKLCKLIVDGKTLPRRLQLLCYNCHAKKDLRPWWYENV
jgi:hypothetical protein